MHGGVERIQRGHLWATNSAESGEEWIASRHHGEDKVSARSDLAEADPDLVEASCPMVKGPPSGSGDCAGLI